MVDFSKHLASGKPEKKLHPIEIYDSLDRKSDKGPLRPTQEAMLSKWYELRLAERDIILKLHTGEGKTLTGLLMLQSKLNLNQGPALYLCPDKYLAEQTQAQADKFGIKWCTIGEDRQLPADFRNSKSILITHVQKLFNGKSKFGLGNRAEPVGAIVLDDSHACIDTIRNAFTIKLTREAHGSLFDQLFSFFEDDLRHQSMARTEEVKAQEWNVLMPVPY
jgi:replicative superfamily II helicase